MTQAACEMKVDGIEELRKRIGEESVVYKRQKLQASLVEQLVAARDYKNAAEQASQLVTELKKINDNQTIVGVHLQQSKAFYGLAQLERARVAMSHARIAANYTNISTKLEASINMQMGILYAADENDFKNAESYFQEAFKGFDTDAKKDYDPEAAMLALKYVLLSKIMLDKSDDAVKTLERNSKYAGRELDSMVAIANAAKNRSFSSFKKAFTDFPRELVQDPVVKQHFDHLYKTMVEKDLSRVMQPYSIVKLDYVAKKIGLDVPTVKQHLAEMVADGKLRGLIDEEHEEVELLGAKPKDCVAKLVLDVIKELRGLPLLRD